MLTVLVNKLRCGPERRSDRGWPRRQPADSVSRAGTTPARPFTPGPPPEALGNRGSSRYLLVAVALCALGWTAPAALAAQPKVKVLSDGQAAILSSGAIKAKVSVATSAAAAWRSR